MHGRRRDGTKIAAVDNRRDRGAPGPRADLDGLWELGAGPSHCMEERLRDGTRSGLRAAGLTAGRGRTTKARCVLRARADHCWSGPGQVWALDSHGDENGREQREKAACSPGLSSSCSRAQLRCHLLGKWQRRTSGYLAERRRCRGRQAGSICDPTPPPSGTAPRSHASPTGHAAPKLGLPFAQGVAPTAPMRCGRLEPSRWGPLAASPDWRPRAGIRHRKRRLLAPSSHRIRSTPSLLARWAGVQGHHLGVCKRRCGAIPPFCRHDRRTSTCSDRSGFDSPGERTPPAHAPCGNHRSCAPPRSEVA